jgi:hypothetical protein
MRVTYLPPQEHACPQAAQVQCLRAGHSAQVRVQNGQCECAQGSVEPVGVVDNALVRQYCVAQGQATAQVPPQREPCQQKACQQKAWQGVGDGA